MHKKSHAFLGAAAVIASTLGATAQTISTTTYSGENRTVTVTAITPNIIRVTNTPEGVEPAPSRTLRYTENRMMKGDVFSTATGEVLSTYTGVTAMLDKYTGAVTITAGPGRTVVDNGVRVKKDGQQMMTLSTPGNESFYGAGERGYHFNLAGDTLVMFNKQNYGYTKGEERIKQMNITMPILLSSNGYAVIFDDYAASKLVVGHPLEYITETDVPVTYYFVNGMDETEEVNLASLTQEITSITGRQQLPPLWSLGYITSKYGYHTEAETRGVVDTLKRAGYPLDGIVLDLYWYGKEEDMGRLAWDKEQWPTHHKMLADLKKKGVNLVAISQPYVLRNGRAIDNYNELAPKGMLVKDADGNPGQVTIWVGSGGMFDVSNPDTRKWLADRYQQLTDDGITGWWGDLGEPEVHPDSLVHYNGLPARLYHNLYGNDWSQIIFDMFQEKYPDRRLMTMMRGGTTGLQRFNVFPWSTDVSRSWGGLQPQVTIMLNSGLSGLGYMSHDVGGFAIDPENPVDPELYVRWLQLGTFSPILRTHAQQVAEPYHYTEHQDIILPLIRERYAWLPYNYTLAYENAAFGYPLVRPLNFYSGDNRYDNIEDEYLWGYNVLVAPVLTQGATEREITFPDGTWIDPTDPTKVYHGDDVITYPAPLNVLPMFIRSGSFIPRADYKMNNTGDYRTDKYTVRYYAPDKDMSAGILYEDDLTSPTNVEDGNYGIVSFVGESGNDYIVFSSSYNQQGEGYKPAKDTKEITFEVVETKGEPKSVTVDGKKVKWSYDPATYTVTIPTKWNIAAPQRVAISF